VSDIISTSSPQPLLLVNAQATDDDGVIGAFDPAAELPSYCDQQRTAFKDYKNIQCTNHLTLNEMSQQSLNSLWIYTHMRQKVLQRVCSSEKRNITDFATRCVDTEIVRADCFIQSIEDVHVKMSMVYSTSWGKEGSPSEVKISRPDGTYELFNTQEGDIPQAKLSTVISMADGSLTLESRNRLSYSSGGEADVGDPVYRLTGMLLAVRVTLENVRQHQPFDYSVQAQISVSLNSKGTWYSPGASVFYFGVPELGNPLHFFERVWMLREYHGVELMFIVGGTIGTPEFFMCLTAVTNAFVLIGMATFMVDLLGAFISDTFKDDRFEDDEERQGLEDMLDFRSDSGVPFDLDLLRMRQADGQFGEPYEKAILRLQAEVQQLSAMWRTKLPLEDKLLEQVKRRFHESRDAHFHEADPDAARYKLVRRNDRPSDENSKKYAGKEHFLVAGENVIGRGTGGVRTHTISRTQIWAYLDEDAPRPLTVRSLRGPVEQSCPAYKFKGVPEWNLLRPGETVDLAVGDCVVLQLREFDTGKRSYLAGVFELLEHSPKLQASPQQDVFKMVSALFGSA